MRRLSTRLEGLVVLEPTVFGDERGFFAETFRANLWAEHGVDETFVQDNHSRSRRGTVRGMHFQTEPGQAKLVRCARGSVLDVVVDLRRGSPTFGEWEAVELDDVAMRQVFVPVGFAHGFCVTSAEADFTYKCSSYYDAAIAWPDVELVVSDRDRRAPRLAEVAGTLPYRF